MISAVDAEDAVHFHLCSTLDGNVAGHLLRSERYFRELVAFNHFVMHLLVAAGASTFPTLCVNDQRAAGCARSSIKPHLSLLQRERATHRMKRILQCERDLCLRRIKMDN